MKVSHHFESPFVPYSASPSPMRLEKRLHPVSLCYLISFRHSALIKCWRTTCLSYFQQLSSTPSETYNPVVIYFKKKIYIRSPPPLHSLVSNDEVLRVRKLWPWGGGT